MSANKTYRTARGQFMATYTSPTSVINILSTFDSSLLEVYPVDMDGASSQEIYAFLSDAIDAYCEETDEF